MKTIELTEEDLIVLLSAMNWGGAPALRGNYVASRVAMDILYRMIRNKGGDELFSKISKLDNWGQDQTAPRLRQWFESHGGEPTFGNEPYGAITTGDDKPFRQRFGITNK